MRGEKAVEAILRGIKYGSPPRARGKVRRHVGLCARVGITPACAGKRHDCARTACVYRDHPRVRGEKSSDFICSDPVGGSPPRARGKGFPHGVRGYKMGITPACAGKREAVCGRRKSKKDHPRVRGEKRLSTNAESRNGGSPPRARGKDPESAPADWIQRITPACAGKSQRRA